MIIRVLSLCATVIVTGSACARLNSKLAVAEKDVEGTNCRILKATLHYHMLISQLAVVDGWIAFPMSMLSLFLFKMPGVLAKPSAVVL